MSVVLVVSWRYHRGVCELCWLLRGGTIGVYVRCVGYSVAVP